MNSCCHTPYNSKLIFLHPIDKSKQTTRRSNDLPLALDELLQLLSNDQFWFIIPSYWKIAIAMTCTASQEQLLLHCLYKHFFCVSKLFIISALSSTGSALNTYYNNQYPAVFEHATTCDYTSYSIISIIFDFITRYSS
jgi:hypothetical protein